MTNAQAIVAAQLDYYNQNITEISPNIGFTNKIYQAAIRLVGWYSTGEWCAFSAILACKNGYLANGHPEIWDYFHRLDSGNSQQMARKCMADKFWPTGRTPRVGAVIVWQMGDSFDTGHTGLCIAVDPDGIHYTTLEGNSTDPTKPNPAGASEREGWTIGKHVHIIGAPHSSNGLNYLRAIYAVEQLP